MAEANTITFANGGRLKEWLIFGGTVLSIVVAAVVAWVTLCNQVRRLEEHTTTIATTGTMVSQANVRTIIEIKQDVRYTRAAVDKMDQKLERIYDRIN